MYPLMQRVLFHLRQRTFLGVKAEDHIVAGALIPGQCLVGIDQGLRRALFEGFAVVPKRHESGSATKLTKIEALSQIYQLTLVERVKPVLSSPRQHTGEFRNRQRCLIGHSVRQGGVQPGLPIRRDAGNSRFPVD
ncbi:hypothetical protein D3C84_1039460 [compost metagenome]